MTMPKIVNEVKRAYKKTGYNPICRNWFDRTCNGACALAALMKYKNPSSKESACKLATRLYGEEYVDGFVLGFDYGQDAIEELRLYPRVSNSYTRGVRAGAAAKRAIHPVVSAA